MGEFLAVGKKLDFLDETLIVRAFHSADTDASGKLDPEQFIVAYETMYNHSLEASSGPDESYVRALRYGIDKSLKPAKIIMELYSGSISAISKYSDLLEETEEDVTGGLDMISAMMLRDGIDNQRYGSNVLWWVDVSVKEVLPSVAAALIQNFGLPPDVETCFFNDHLTPDRDSRVRMGPGKISKPAVKKANGGDALEVQSLSLFVQSMWLKNLPVVHEYGVWVDYLWPPPLQNFAKYLSSRLSQFYSFAGVIDLEHCRSLLRACKFAEVCSLR